MTTKTPPEIQSDALKANLLETATDEVTTDPVYSVLFEVVTEYRGIHSEIGNSKGKEFLKSGDRLNFSTSLRGLNFFRGFSESTLRFAYLRKSFCPRIGSIKK